MCSLKCKSEESQTHIFESCKLILDKLGVRSTPKFSKMFGTQHEQKQAITVFCSHGRHKKITYKGTVINSVTHTQIV